ncbi:hypothetical protein HMPREF3173_16050 [Pseudomonas sp. HMSC08G10]|uniref:hypothetical protein n=1 Tax=Pseudomonas sp. HMSC08G10 TaxID=1581141 RepID=UPI0008A45895|nr:hypothetical protein [Pseudomonas sp. HMSC08G10]OFS72048.1 hypothetical protein HMPREF3173_16050 [Pseudomonas sp. HMSC08G10]
MQQSYVLTIRDLFAVREGAMVGDHSEVAILNGGIEIDRIKVSGKIGPGGDGYQRKYDGGPGLSAKLLTKVGQITFAAI